MATKKKAQKKTFDHRNKKPAPKGARVKGRRESAQFVAGKAPSEKELARRLVTVDQRDQSLEHPVAGMKPADLAAILSRAQDGYDWYRLQDLYSDIQVRTPRIGGNCSTRRLAVLNLPWTVEAADSENSQDEEIADACKSAIRWIDGLRDSLEHLLEGPARGVAACEIMWERSGKQLVPVALPEVAHRKLIYNRATGGFNFYTDDQPKTGVEMSPYKFILNRVSRGAETLKKGFLMSGLWYDLFGRYGIKDWVSFLDVYGFPLRVGKYPNNARDEDIQVLVKAILDLASDAGAVIPAGCEIEFVEAQKAGTSAVFKQFVEFLLNELTIVILGQTLTTSTGGTGSYALGRVHENVRQDLVEADALRLMDAIDSYLIVPFVDLNYGPRSARSGYPRFKIEYEPATDEKLEADTKEVRARTLETLQRMGVQIGKKQVQREFDIDEVEDDDEVLEAPASPAAGPLGFAAAQKKTLDAGLEFAAADPIDSFLRIALSRGRRAFNPLRQELEKIISQGSFDSVESLLKSAINNPQSEMLDEFAESIALSIHSARLGARAEIIDYLSGFEEVKFAAGQFARSDIFPPEPLPPEEAIKYFSGKIPLRADEFYALLDQARQAAFTVSGITRKRVLEVLQEELSRSLSEGLTLDTFRKNAADQLVGFSDFRIETIFRTNLQTAYNAGRWEQLKSPEVAEAFPAYKYVTAGDSAVRDEHAAMDGKVFAADDPVWDTWWPPNGFNCRCQVVPVHRSQSYQVSQWRPTARPEEGFQSSPSSALASLARGELPV